MAILTWPDEVLPNSMAFGLSSNTGIFESPLNRSVSTHGFLGDRWMGTLNFNSLDNNEVRELDILQAFLFRLGGINGRFLMGDLSKPGMPAKGSPVVQGAGQYGGILQTSGWLPNQVVLPKGSYFSINNELKMVTADIVSNQGGVATLEFRPWLRKSPNSGDVIVTDKPVSMFRLADDDVLFNIDPGNAEISIDVVESFNV